VPSRINPDTKLEPRPIDYNVLVKELGAEISALIQIRTECRERRLSPPVELESKLAGLHIAWDILHRQERLD
jgi:hypothetical protein